MSAMKALTLWQPWASLLMLPGVKDHETRPWPCPPKYIGRRIAIHAAKADVPFDEVSSKVHDICRREFVGAGWSNRLPFGSVIGTAIVAECREIGYLAKSFVEPDDYECGNFAPGRYAWRITDRVLFDAPIPARGMQKLWTWEVPEGFQS